MHRNTIKRVGWLTAMMAALPIACCAGAITRFQTGQINSNGVQIICSATFPDLPGTVTFVRLYYNSQAAVDWGDGVVDTFTNTSSNDVSHDYGDNRNRTIGLSSSDGSIGLQVMSEAGIISISSANISSSSPNLQIMYCPNFTSISLPNMVSGEDIWLIENGLGSLSFPALATVNRFSAENSPNLKSLLLTNLQHVTTGELAFNNCPVLPEVGLGSLQDVAGIFYGNACSLLTNVDLPNLVTAGGFYFVDSANLTRVNLPVWVPTNGGVYDFSGCALDGATVDQVLARCVANAAFISGSVGLADGTSAAPGTQGALDKATLIARGVSVTTN